MSEQNSDHGATDVDRWLVKTAEGPLSADDRRAFQAWLAADAEHARAFEAGKTAISYLDALQGDARLEDMARPSFSERIANTIFNCRERAGSLSIPKLVWPAAGILAAGACLFLAMFVSRSPATVEPITYTTQVAETRDIALGDGSVLSLGAASSVEVLYEADERRVTLSEGEAFFAVVKDEARPFVVAARGTIVRVHGTRFDVSLSGAGVAVAVAEGEVSVRRTSNGIGEKAGEEQLLTSGQKVVVDASGVLSAVQTIAAEDVGAWRRGELIWVNAPVRDIIADLNRYSTVRIRLLDDDAGEERYTLVLQATETNKAVSLIAETLSLDVERRPDGEIVLR